jgi:hypothetical protein
MHMILLASILSASFNVPLHRTVVCSLDVLLVRVCIILSSLQYPFESACILRSSLPYPFESLVSACILLAFESAFSFRDYELTIY